MARRAPPIAVRVYTFGCTHDVEDCTPPDRRHAQPDNRMPRLAVLLAAAACALAAQSVASSPSTTLGEQGHAPTRVLAFDELPGEPELNHMAFGPDGLLFATSRGGFYTNDGASWRFHPSINAHDSLPSLHIDRAGRVFTARGKEPLMAVPQADGSYRWQSLASPTLPPEENLSWVHCIHAGEGAWFQTLGKSSRGYALWHWHEGTWRKIHANATEPYLSGPAGVFVRNPAGRLQRLAPGTPEEIGPAPTEPIRSISSPIGDTGIWFVATASELHRVTRAACTVWPNEAADYLRAHKIARIFSRPDGSLVVATNDGAIVQLDAHGRWRGLSSAENGLPEATFLNATFDDADGLWNVYSNQLARVDLAASHTVFDA
ncbi:MAG TPA: hypothetical protein VEA63_00430, partial [Opitutus sp.]|nr:hypothetical protein [Opitutus sp.]